MATLTPASTSARPGFRLTARDLRLLEFIAAHRFVLAAHAILWMGADRAVAYKRLGGLTDLGLLSYVRPFDDQPGAFSVTLAGLKLILSRLSVPVIDLGCFRHDAALVSLQLAIAASAPGPVLTERQMRSYDREPSEDPFFLELHQLGPGGRPRRHYPDLVIIAPDGRRRALELELTLKSRARLELVLVAYAAHPPTDTGHLHHRHACGRPGRHEHEPDARGGRPHRRPTHFPAGHSHQHARAFSRRLAMRSRGRDQAWMTQAAILLIGLIVLVRFVSIQLIVAAALGVEAFRIARSAYRRYDQQQRAVLPASTPGGVLVGHDAKTKEPVSLSDEQLSAHGLIVGASGSGKTTSLLTILTGSIQQGRAVVMIDLKGSPTVTRTLEAAAKAAGRPFHLWTPDGPGHWNPLALGNPTELKDKLISTESWTEPHYQRAAERYLQTALQVLALKDPIQKPSLEQVVAMLEPKRLAASLGTLPPERAQRIREYLAGLTSDQRSAINGLATRLAVISESHTGAYLEPNGQATIDLAAAIEEKAVVVFSLNASAYGKLSAQLAAIILQDLTLIAGHRLNNPDRELAIIAIDEFSALDHSNILGLFSRARDAKLSILLSTQELADLHITPGLQDQILGSSALTLAHRQNVPSSAETIAKLTGTQTTWEHTWQTDANSSLLSILTGKQGAPHDTGLGTKREVEQFRIHPNIIKELPTGHAVLITRTPTTTARIIKVLPPTTSEQHHDS